MVDLVHLENIKTKMLEVKKFTTTYGRSAFDLELQAEINYHIPETFVRLMMRMVVEDPIIFEHKYPLSLWNEIKERFFPKWWLRRFPVKYKRYKHEIQIQYPDMALPDRRHNVLHTYVDIREW
jgi:hypothetical protein